MSQLKIKIQDDMKNALRNHEKQRLSIIRLITAAIKQIEVDERVDLDDARVIAILDKMVKQRRDSIEQFKKAQRNDLIDQEEYELSIINEYLPEALSDEDVALMINEAVKTTGANSIKDMGKVMGILKPQVQGRTDMQALAGKIKERLSP